MKSFTTFVLAALAITAPASAQLDLSWHTVDGGGATACIGGNFALGGTIGQPDAQAAPVMTGGSFQLSGGFWPGIGSACTLPGDLNFDGQVDGDDVQLFINCVVSGTGSCGCADLDGGGIGASDVAMFVSALLGGSGDSISIAGISAPKRNSRLRREFLYFERRLPSNCPQIASRNGKKPCRNSTSATRAKSLSLRRLGDKIRLWQRLRKRGRTNPPLSVS